MLTVTAGTSNMASRSVYNVHYLTQFSYAEVTEVTKVSGKTLKPHTHSRARTHTHTPQARLSEVLDPLG